uniref:uroporphyrinogen-III C-methyltransferase n=1 Tax=Archaeoglobus fulgidus TaxID=2234 RepID=A0A7C3M951_ARCFL
MGGKVYIVGAGPGNFELLTLKAYRLLKEADVILYDRLVGEEIESYLKTLDKEIVYVGKERGEKGERRQEEINRLMKKYCEEGKKVVRLKGGDPGIFGRMAEEIEFLAENNIPFEVVPGVSSVNGAPVSSGIPLTHPEKSYGFLVVSGRDSGRIKELHQNGTLVILMGGCTAREVAKNLIESGISADRDVAVIEKGSMKDQRVTLTKLGELAEKDFNFESPALIVVGDVAVFARLYRNEDRKI